MPDNDNNSTRPNLRVLRKLPLLIILGLAVHLLVPQISSLEHSWAVVKGLSWWAIALAVVAQIFSYFGNGYLIHSLLRINKQKLSTARGTLISVASQSVGLVAGGWLGGAAATYNWIRDTNRDANTSVMAGTLPSIINNSVLIAVALIGTFYLLIVHDLSRVQLIEFGTILLVIGVLAVLIYTIFRSPALLIKFVNGSRILWAKIRRKPFSPTDLSEKLEKFLNSWRSIKNGNWVHPLIGSIANIGFDILTLYFVFLATGHNVSLEVLLAGYGLPILLGKMAFIIPGGVGVIEGGMVAVYDSLNVPNEISVVVILGYRLISFWLPTLVGFMGAMILSRKNKTNQLNN